MAAKGVTRGQFATTSTYTPDAVTFVKGNAINLLAVDGLLALIRHAHPGTAAGSAGGRDGGGLLAAHLRELRGEDA